MKSGFPLLATFSRFLEDAIIRSSPAWLAASFCVVALLTNAPATHATELNLRLIGSQQIATGTLFQGIEFGGISGLDLLVDGTYVGLSDDRGGERGTPRFYNLSLSYDGAGFSGVTINSQTFMQRPDGSAFPSSMRTVDPEGIRLLPNGNLAWSSEGNWSSTPSARYQPFVREMRLDGSYVGQYTLPAMFDYVDNTTTGGRNNKLFEALAVTPNGMLYTANEDALIQDGNITTLTSGSVVRVTAIKPSIGMAGAQYAYLLPPIPVDAAPGAPFGPDNGLPELLAIDDTSFIALERAFASGVGNTIRLVRTTITSQTTDVSGVASLIGATYTPMTREVLLEMPLVYEGIVLDDMEGMSWGQTLANGNRTLVLVADNNFSSTQRTLFMAFEVSVVPEPATGALLICGLAALMGWRRVRTQASA
jgi:hypothetical protein